MKCAQHPDLDAAGYCRQCGKPLCPECKRDVRGALYCENCLASIVASPHATPPTTATSSHPGAALALGFIPGLGAVYNGEYVKALIHVAVFGGIIAALSSDLPGEVDAFLGIALGCFYFYMPIEAYRVAKARELGQPQPPDLMQSEGQKPIGAIILIGLGVLSLLANFHLLARDWFSKVWPVGLILLGAWILMDRMRKTS
ncbi:MAG TPA: DUF5668 domain-containing protein [Candidatus Acidoferrales bacterium]|jgi:hypothetical protein|nr:DUF5668 domain-containing protein [Candidatus Acidoferrales bacterium]